MKIDQALLEAALVGYLHQKDQITAKIAEIQEQLGQGQAPKEPAGSGDRSRGMSPSARARIAAAQRKRWAEYHKNGGKKVTASKAAPKVASKRVLSPGARKRIADATRKRWAAYRAEKAAAQQG
jgi:hypothetical protein